jgi:hypothetical protein
MLKEYAGCWRRLMVGFSSNMGIYPAVITLNHQNHTN